MTQDRDSTVGWQTFELRSSQLGGDQQEVKGFGVGYGIRVVVGAQFVGRLELLAGHSQAVDPARLADGALIATPNGFHRAIVTFADDAGPAVARVVLEVLKLPAAVAVDVQPQPSGSRIVFESALHLDGAASSVVLGSTQGDSELLCRAVAGQYQLENQSQPTASGVDRYLSRNIGDQRAPWWPCADLFIDGFVGVSTANVELQMLALTVDGTGNLQRFPWFLWTSSALVSSSTWEANTGPAFALTQTRCFPLSMRSSGTPVMLPPDGFELWAVATGAGGTVMQGFIGGRTA